MVLTRLVPALAVLAQLLDFRSDSGSTVTPMSSVHPRCRGISEKIDSLFCDSFLGWRQQKVAAALAERTAACNWTEVKIHGGPSSFGGIEKSQQCLSPTPAGAWAIERVGPINMSPKNPITSLWYHAFQTMFDAPINATASLIHFVYDNGTEVDYPPLHMHHAHLEKPEGGFYFSETHGDGRCYGRDGHSCYLQTMPKGYVFANVSGFETRCHVNSVGEARLRGVYYEIAVHNADATHTDKLRPLHAGILSVPPFLHKDLLGLKGYMVPTDKVTLSYGCTQFPKKARVVGAKWHTHGLMVHEILIFVATPHELGLDDDPAFAQQLYTSNETVPGVAKCGAFPKQGLLQRGPETPITMAEKIWDTRHQPDQKKMHPAFKSGYADLGAHGMTAQGTVEKLLAAHGDKLYTRLGPNSGRSENVNGTEFGRRTAVPLARHDFEAGEVLTVVAVNAKQPGAAGPMFDGGVDFLMHTALWMLFEMEGGVGGGERG